MPPTPLAASLDDFPEAVDEAEEDSFAASDAPAYPDFK
jgi:hypothetical protein